MNPLHEHPIAARYALAMLASGMAGFSLGIGAVIDMVYPILSFEEAPQWVPHAEYMGWLGLAGAGLSAVGWMCVDYRYGVET